MQSKGDLRAELEAERARTAELSAQLAAEQRIDGLANVVRRELGSAAIRDQIDAEADNLAVVAVIAEETERIAANTAERLKSEKREEYLATFRANGGASMEENIRDALTESGEFERIRLETIDKLKADIQQEVLDAERSRVEEEFSQPGVLEKLRAEIVASLSETGVLDDYRRRKIESLQGNWHDELVEEAKAIINMEEEAKEADFKGGQLAELLESMQTYRAKVRKANEKKWKEATAAEVAEQIDDEELRHMLAERAELEIEKHDKEIKATKLLAAFETSGINLMELVKDDVVEIYLGEYTTFKIKEIQITEDAWHNKSKKEVLVDKLGVSCERRFLLCAQGDGRFVVNSDSAHDSPNAYERVASINRGVVLTFGRKIEDNGNRKLEPVLTADVPPYYDTDSTDDEITDSQLQIANVIVNGISARTVEVINNVWEK